MPRKKLRLNRRIEVLTRDPAQLSFVTLKKFGLLFHSYAFSASPDYNIAANKSIQSLLEERQPVVCVVCSWPRSFEKTFAVINIAANVMLRSMNCRHPFSIDALPISVRPAKQNRKWTQKT
jgi:hypothetical protein